MINNIMTGVKLYFGSWLSKFNLSSSFLLILVQFIIVINGHRKKNVYRNIMKVQILTLISLSFYF